jgi:hypothetical protein
MRALLALLAFLLPMRALACEPLPYPQPVPTNIELLREADLVVLAQVIEGGSDFTVQLRPVAALKGTPPDGPLEAPGTKGDGEQYRLDVTPLDASHFSSRWGSCVRQGYHEGAMVLALLSRTSRGYSVLNHAFARNIEDVRDGEDLWPRAARLYLATLAGPDPDRAFAKLATGLEAKQDADSQAIARDIRTYLSRTSP